MEKSQTWVAQSPFKKLNFGNSSQINMQKQISNFSCSVLLDFFYVERRMCFQVFPNSLRDEKVGFLNVAPAGIVDFSQFMEEIEYWDFRILPSFSQFTKSWEIGIFSLAFIFCQIVRIFFQAGYMCWIDEPKVIM